LVPKGTTDTGTESRLGKYGNTCSRHRHLVLPNQKYPRPRNHCPIPTPASANQHLYSMGDSPQLRRVAASLFLAVGLICIPGRSDTHVYDYPPRGNRLCACGCENASNAPACAPSCSPQLCQGGRENASYPRIVRSPLSSGSSDHPARSRPAYSRKSNRTQRARL
jgi:hypothetical protein